MWSLKAMNEKHIRKPVSGEAMLTDDTDEVFDDGVVIVELMSKDFGVIADVVVIDVRLV